VHPNRPQRNSRLLLNVQINPLLISNKRLLLKIKLKLQLQGHFLNMNQHGLLESSTLLVQLASDLLLGGKIGLKRKLDWFVLEFHQKLVEN